MTAPELAASMAETRQLRELLAEILGRFTGGTSEIMISDAVCRVAPSLYVSWRERAGLPS